MKIVHLHFIPMLSFQSAGMFLLFFISETLLVLLTDFLAKKYMIEIQTPRDKLKKSEAQCRSLTVSNNHWQLKLYKVKIEHRHSFM